MSTNPDYPLPPYAAHVWTQGHELCLGFPPTDGERGHVVRMPLERCEAIASSFGGVLANQRGWRLLLDTLKARERAGTARPIGTEAAPVQYDVNQILKLMGPAAPKVQRIGQGATSLADLGLED